MCQFQLTSAFPPINCNPRGWRCWRAEGCVPQCVHADNGSDFTGEALRRGCEDYGIRLEFRPPGRAHFGGHIERLIGTLMQRVHTLPGTTYSNPLDRGDYRSEKAACLTLKELEYWLTLEICVHYHGAIHRTLGTSPLVAWERAVQRGIRQWLPEDPRRFYIGFLPVEDRTLQRTGVQLENIRYWSDALPTIARFKDTVSVRYDPSNMSRVYIRGSQSPRPSAKSWMTRAPRRVRCAVRSRVGRPPPAIHPLNVRSLRVRIRPDWHGLYLECNSGQRGTRTPAGSPARSYFSRCQPLFVKRLSEIHGGLLTGVHRLVGADSRVGVSPKIQLLEP